MDLLELMCIYMHPYYNVGLECGPAWGGVVMMMMMMMMKMMVGIVVIAVRPLHAAHPRGLWRGGGDDDDDVCFFLFFSQS